MTINRRQFVQTLAGSAAIAAGVRPAFGQAAEFQMKWANNIPATHPSTIRVKEAAEKIKAETKGRVDIQVFPNNQLGGDTDMLSQIRSGAIDFFPLSGLILQTLVPVAAINGVGLRVQGLRHGVGGDGRRPRRVRARGDRQGRPAHVRQVLGQRLPPDHQQHQADQHAGRPQGLQDPRAGQPAVDLDVQGARRVADQHQFQRVYSALQTKVVEGQENPLALHRDRQALRSAEVLLDDQPHVGRLNGSSPTASRGQRLPEDLQAIVTKNVTRGRAGAARGHRQAQRGARGRR